ncbi:type I restriction endonuclease subunit R [Staphylococcus felis]|uniref:type I restriction endonuclease subunit R n=1 Tax=Staphylococcus felis TaxID=46127 RepID=UPI000CD08125|nr:type I restriction endonuclease subunit R [Staphylococcus felis]AVP36170.1 type I restriction endonuclease subunit R [Staphylococcus felis]PNZ35756.1 restriction endonuclease subunit R [Staphylococcus felis]QQB03860.1 type I restriction endonuclease subunit R [Staphylococcus felis]REH94585.1 type I restriction endonuclease subunit R [Staphylococcus felis]REI18200.1 type I restriction endonuclease subunit R [Staphylococcus felis]
MAYQSEFALENEVLQQLEHLGYERVNIHNVEQLYDNLRAIINERHEAKLEGKPLTDSEFQRLLTDINGKSVFDSAMQLRDRYILRRDDETVVSLELMNTKKWCQNKFQVTNQISVKDKYKSRYDVTILINGLPVTQIELKRSGVAISEAFNQIERYRRQNFTGLFRYLQLFVVSNKMETRYYANSDREILKAHMFYWTDEKNERINYLKDFIKDFLEPCHLAKMISRYMIVNETDKILMALRPYQVYAVEAILNRALETNNNGYIWHTTGSGKTLTSFKASQLLSQEEEIKKVIFLVDRKDLDSQTLAEFNKFQDDSVDFTQNTKKLLKQLEDPSQHLIVTTIQKMANAVKSGEAVMDRYREDKVIFIIDECHRTQFGEMHRLIKRHFQNAQYFGFTGTPRFEANKSQDGRATADIFDKCLHYYLIKDAIRDGNVLGFSVEYNQTFNTKENMNEDYVDKINTSEVWMDEERLQLVAEHIVRNYSKKTHQGKYTTMFTVQSIPMAIAYYDIFRKLKQEGKHDLNITTIFTYQANEDTHEEEYFEHSREVLDRVMVDYNQTFGTNYDTDHFDGYFSDVSKRMKSVVPGEKIDILIIVNMFLTGFDSKKLNTLYVDRNLQHHDLIQAYSRTNRIEKETKPYGNIVCYRDLKRQTDEAIEIFSQTDNTDTVLSLSYDEYLTVFKDTLKTVYTLAPTPLDVDNLESEEQQKAFVESFRELSNTLVKLKTFDAFEFSEDELNISEQTYEDYKGKYLAIYENVIRREKNNEEGVSILDDIDFKIELMRNDLINVKYIMDLIGQINLSNKNERDEKRRQIHQLLDKADDEQLRLKADLIRQFIDRVVPSLKEDADINEAYYDYEEQQKLKEIDTFAQQHSMSPTFINEVIGEYEYSGHIDRKQVRQNITGNLIQRKKKTDDVVRFVEDTSGKYSYTE